MPIDRPDAEPFDPKPKVEPAPIPVPEKSYKLEGIVLVAIILAILAAMIFRG